MSSCLCTLHKDFIFIAADTRGSYFTDGDEGLKKYGLEGDKFATVDTVQKIFHINNQVVYVSGIFDLMKSIIANYEMSDNQTVDELANIATKLYNIFRITSPHLKKLFDEHKAAELIVATVENKKCVIYSLSETRPNFKPERYEGQNYPIPITMGVAAPEMLKDLKHKLYKELHLYTTGNRVDIEKLYLDIYSKYAEEQMGGYMQLFNVSPIKIYEYEKVRIPDSREIKRIPSFILKKLSEHCTAEHGFQIDLNRGTKENPIWDNTVYISPEGHFTIDGGYIKLLTENNQNQIFLDPEKGIMIQRNIGTFENPSFQDRFFVTTEGDLVARQLKTDSSTNNYIVLREQMVDFYNNSLRKIQIGFQEIDPGTFVPYMLLGAGDGNGGDRASIVKQEDSLTINYLTSNGLRNYINFVNNSTQHPLGAIVMGAAIDFSNAFINFDNATLANLNLGDSGTFESADGKTITVKNGMVESIL